MNKKTLSERDICTKYITPAIINAGWDLQKQVMECAITSCLTKEKRGIK